MKIVRLLTFVCSILIQKVGFAAPIDVQAAIARGSQYKSRAEYIEKGMRDSRIVFHTLDAISRVVTLFDDFDVIAAAAAEAKQQMRPFTAAQAQGLPLTGLVYAHVSLAGFNQGVPKLQNRYVQNPAHMVLQFGTTVVQPLNKQLNDGGSIEAGLPISLYTFWSTKHASILTGIPLGFLTRQVELEFAFQLSPVQMQSPTTATLIDGLGNHHEKQVDLAKLLH